MHGDIDKSQMLLDNLVLNDLPKPKKMGVMCRSSLTLSGFNGL